MISKSKTIEEVTWKKRQKKAEKKSTDKKTYVNANANDQDDETSDSSSDSSSSEEDENDIIIKKSNSKHEIIVREEDFEENEKLNFSQDVYNFTICANMTKCCSPLQQGFALKQCFIVFGVQILVAIFFLIDIGIASYQPPTTESNAIRIICSLLLHMIIYGEVKQALSILRYLKFVKTAKGGKRGRFINILLCSMQMISPFVTETVLILAIGQTYQLSMIIKSFVALGFVTKIDDMFSENFPNEIKTTADSIHLIIGKDQNTNKRIWARIKKARKEREPVDYKQAFFNLIINFWYTLINNFYIIFYYYFFPLICILL